MSSGSRQGLPQCGPGASFAARVQPHDGDSPRTRLWFGGEAVLGGPLGLPGERFLGVIITHQESAINSGDCQQFPVELEFDLVFHSTLTCWVSAIDLNLKFDLING